MTALPSLMSSGRSLARAALLTALVGLEILPIVLGSIKEGALVYIAGSYDCCCVGNMDVSEIEGKGEEGVPVANWRVAGPVLPMAIGTEAVVEVMEGVAEAWAGEETVGVIVIVATTTDTLVSALADDDETDGVTAGALDEEDGVVEITVAITEEDDAVIAVVDMIEVTRAVSDKDWNSVS